MSEFKWTDELVKEFVKFPILAGETSKDVVDMNMRHFKEYVTLRNEKPVYQQPKQEWEIIDAIDSTGFVHNWLDRTCLHKSSSCKIHSVKRLSDGEVFTVGDSVSYDTIHGKYAFIIERFEIKCAINLLAYAGLHGVNISLFKSSKLAPVLLTPSQLEKLNKILNTTP